MYSLSFDFTTVAVTLPLALLIALAMPFRLVSPSARSTVSGLVVPGWLMVMVRVVPVVAPSCAVALVWTAEVNTWAFASDLTCTL